MEKKEYSLEVGGRTMSAVFTDLADQTNGSVMIRYGNTVVLATAVMSKGKREGIDFFPLVVDYEEKFYAAGRILGSRFLKREGRPSDEAILSGRIVDRTIRPLFDWTMRNEVQVVLTVLSIDENNDPDVAAVIGASLALGTSDIPWAGPVSAVRIGLNKEATTGAEKLAVNPTYNEREETSLDLLVCGKDGKVNMIESEAKEVNEGKIMEALELATAEIEKIQSWQKQIIEEIGKTKKVIESPVTPAEMKELFAKEILPTFANEVFTGVPGKGHIGEIHERWKKILEEKMPDYDRGLADALFEHELDELIHREAINNNRRPDGRAMDQLRPIQTQAGGISPVVHGTGIFYRGGTHIMTMLTLGSPKEAQLVEGMEVQTKRYFMHHYNFPPFSTGETGRMGGTNRRSVGHGALAEKSLRAIIPSRDIFPYTIRLVSEAMASNGSTSMGSVCGSTLALMDGGVPIKAPVAGIAMGLMSDKNGYKVLTDIQGPEDHHGDMDFKVAGTPDGVTGIQLDIKIDAIPLPILKEALEGAKKARLQLIEEIHKAIAEPRPEISPSAPKIIKITIPVDKIGAVIGPGGKNIQKIQSENSVEIEIEEDGSVYISGQLEGAARARDIVEGMTHEYKVGERFTGTVARIEAFGAFVNIGPGTDGLVHISEFAPFRIAKVEDAVKLGDTVPVVIYEIDEKNRVNLSVKKADPDWAKNKGILPAAPGMTSGPRPGGPRPPFNRGPQN